MKAATSVAQWISALDFQDRVYSAIPNTNGKSKLISASKEKLIKKRSKKVDANYDTLGECYIRAPPIWQQQPPWRNGLAHWTSKIGCTHSEGIQRLWVRVPPEVYLFYFAKNRLIEDPRTDLTQKTVSFVRQRKALLSPSNRGHFSPTNSTTKVEISFIQEFFVNTRTFSESFLC